MFAMTFGAPLTEPLEKAIEAEFAAGALFPASKSAAGLQLRSQELHPALVWHWVQVGGHDHPFLAIECRDAA